MTMVTASGGSSGTRLRDSGNALNTRLRVR